MLIHHTLKAVASWLLRHGHASTLMSNGVSGTDGPPLWPGVGPRGWGVRVAHVGSCLHCWRGASKCLPGGYCWLAWGLAQRPSAAGHRGSWGNIMTSYPGSVCSQSFLLLALWHVGSVARCFLTYVHYIALGVQMLWHQPSSTVVNGDLSHSVGVTSVLDSSSVCFPRCAIIFLLLTRTSTKHLPSLLPILCHLFHCSDSLGW